MNRIAMIWLLGAIGCAGETGGQRVAFEAEARAIAPASGGAITYDDPDTGWRVSLTTARVAIGPVYLWSGKPLGTEGRRDADQFEYGFLRGEVVDQVAIDLVATAGGATPIGAGDGLAGQAQSAELWLAPAQPFTFEVAGTATRGGATVQFRGGLTIDDRVVDESTGDTAFERRKVRGIPFEAEVEEGGVVSIGCDARRWLAGADFSIYVPDPAPAEPIAAEIASPDAVWGQWFYQVRQSRSIGPWSLEWLAP